MFRDNKIHGRNDILKEDINFVGIGAMKSGSTWVAENLSLHPEILFSSQKELNFFNDPIKVGDKILNSFFKKGFGWYLKQFPKSEKGKIRGEFSVVYLFDKLAAKRIKEFFPNIKIIVVLRNPIEMIYSLHNWMKSAALSNLPSEFENAIDKGFYLNLGLYSHYLKIGINF